MSGSQENLYTSVNGSQVHWRPLVILATQETEARVSLEPEFRASLNYKGTPHLLKNKEHRTVLLVTDKTTTTKMSKLLIHTANGSQIMLRKQSQKILYCYIYIIS